MPQATEILMDLANVDPTVYHYFQSFWNNKDNGTWQYEDMLVKIIVHLSEERNSYRKQLIEYISRYGNMDKLIDAK